MKSGTARPFARNYPLLVLEGSFFMGGVGFISTSTVVPVYIDMVTHSRQLVGLALTLVAFFTCFGRIAVGPFMPHVKNHARFSTTVMFLCRPLPLLVPVLIFTGHYTASVAALIVTYAAVWLADGIIVPAWSEVFANTIEPARQGRLLGLQMLLGGGAAIGAGFVISAFVGNPSLDIRTAYGVVFLLGGLCLTVSCVAMALAENAPRPYRTGKIRIWDFYRGLPRLLFAEPDNTRMLAVQFLLAAAGMGIPFIILFASDSLGVPKGAQAALIVAQLIGAPIGGMMWGEICDRFGCENSMRLAGSVLLLAALLPLAAGSVFSAFPLAAVLPAMFLAGLTNGFGNCSYLYTVKVVRPETRSACLVLSSMIGLPAAFSGYFAGLLSEKLGFSALFSLCILLAAAGIVLTFFVRPVRKVLALRGGAPEKP